MNRMISRTLVITAAASLGLPAAGFAANQTIGVGNDKQLSPASVTIGPGDTVTWHWTGPDTDHIIASAPGSTETWDSDPGLNDVNHAVGHTFGHTFAQTGVFPYRCRIHPDKMFGTVTVQSQAAPPTASFTASPASVMTGTDVMFDASASSAVSPRTLLSYTWDLDGDGSFETTSPGPMTTHAFMVSGTVAVGLRVIDSMGSDATTTRIVTVISPPVVLPPPLVVVPPASPILSLTAAAKQAKADTRGVAVSAMCDQACSVVATGWITLPKGKRIVLGRVARSLSGGILTKLSLSVPVKSRATLRTLLAAKKPVSATIKVSQAGATITKTIRLVK